MNDEIPPNPGLATKGVEAAWLVTIMGIALGTLACLLVGSAMLWLLLAIWRHI